MPNDPVGIHSNSERIPGTGGSGLDEEVKVSDNDTTADKLEEKIVAGTGINLNVINEGGDELLQIVAQAGAGSDDEEIIVDFVYSQSTPVFIASVSPLGTVSRVQVYIDTVFDGTAILTVGVPGNTQILMQSDEIDPYSQAYYEVSPGIELADTTVINLYMNLTGVTQGEGRVVLNITR